MEGATCLLVTRLENPESSKYLGSLLKRDIKYNTEIRRRIGRAKVSSWLNKKLEATEIVVLPKDAENAVIMCGTK